MQRLFSMFPNGWPGNGLLILRLTVGFFLVHDGVATVLERVFRGPTMFAIPGAAAGALLVVGLWTPVAGAIAALCGVVVFAAAPAHPRDTLLVALVAAALAMLGPGVWSVDCRLFGRQRMNVIPR